MFYASKNKHKNPKTTTNYTHTSSITHTQKTCTVKVTSVVMLKEKKTTKSPVAVTFNWHVNINYYDITSLVLQQVMAPTTTE